MSWREGIGQDVVVRSQGCRALRNHAFDGLARMSRPGRFLFGAHSQDVDQRLGAGGRRSDGVVGVAHNHRPHRVHLHFFFTVTLVPPTYTHEID